MREWSTFVNTTTTGSRPEHQVVLDDGWVSIVGARTRSDGCSKPTPRGHERRGVSHVRAGQDANGLRTPPAATYRDRFKSCRAHTVSRSVHLGDQARNAGGQVPASDSPILPRRPVWTSLIRSWVFEAPPIFHPRISVPNRRRSCQPGTGPISSLEARWNSPE